MKGIVTIPCNSRRLFLGCLLSWVLSLANSGSAQGASPGSASADPVQAGTDAGGPSVAAATGDGEALTPPRWLDPASPPWPEGASGTASVELELYVSIDAQGLVTDVTATPSQPPTAPPFVQAAREFLARQRFAPAARGQTALPARIAVRLRFEPPAVALDPPGVALEPPAVPPPAPADVPSPSLAVQAPTVQGTGYGAQATVASTKQAVAASAMDIEVGALHAVPRREAVELLTLSPGVVLTNHSGQGHAPSAFLRGFDAGEGQDLEVRVAGVPMNEPSNAHGHGYADTAFVVPEFVRTVRVLQGPFDPRQGDFSAAGSVDFALAAPAAGVRTQLSLGSFGEKRALIGWSPVTANRETFAAADLTQSDGFGHNRSYRNMRGLGQFSGKLDRLSYQVLLASHGLTFDSAGVVREDAVNNGQVDCGGKELDPFYCVLDPNQGGQADRHLLSARIGEHSKRSEWVQQLALMVRKSRFREDFTGALLDTRGDGLDQQTNMMTLSIRGHYRIRGQVGGQPQSLELGYEGRHDRGDSLMWRLRRIGQAPYAVVFDNELSLTHIGLYAAGMLNFADGVNLQIGGRIDTFGYDITDRAQPNADRMGERLPSQTINAWGSNLQPRATLTLGPRFGLRLITGVGVGSRSSDAAALSEGETAPFSRVFAAESGLTGEHDFGRLHAESRAALFFAHVDRDLLFDEAAGRNVPIGATNRYGAFAHVRLQYAERLDLATSFTWAEAHAPAENTLGLNSGPRLPYVPRFVLRTDAAYSDAIALPFGVLQVRSGLGLSWIGPRPLPLGTLSRAFFTLDASLRLRLHCIEWSLSATNLTDRRNRSAEYFYSSDFDTGAPTMTRARHFSAAPPRAFLTTLALVLEI